MAKFMVLYNSSEKASDVMAKSTAEEMQASMQEWIKWADEAKKTTKFDFGLPMQAVSRITSDGVGESDNNASGYSTMEGDKEAIVELVKKHPHLKQPGAWIDLLEMLPLPGMNA